MWVLKCSKNNSTINKCGYGEAANFCESHDVDFDINEPLNLTKMVPVFSMDGRCHTIPFVTHETLMLGIGQVIKPIAMENIFQQ